MTFQIKPTQVGLAAKLSAAKKSSGAELQAPVREYKPEIVFKPVSDPAIKDRLALVFDDSGSMACADKIKLVRDGVIEFLRNCTPNQTAVGIYPLCKASKSMTTNLPELAAYVSDIQASGGTPLVRIILTALNANNQLSRIIAFSDGQPDNSDTTQIVSICNARKIPIDTFFIGNDMYVGANFMRALAEDTGGIFMHLKDPSSVRSGMKYFAPAFRAMLTNGAFKAKVEEGGV